MKGKGCLFLISSITLKEPLIDDGTEGCSLLLFSSFHLQTMHRAYRMMAPSEPGLSGGNRHVQVCEKIACSPSFLHS